MGKEMTTTTGPKRFRYANGSLKEFQNEFCPRMVRTLMSLLFIYLNFSQIPGPPDDQQ